MRRPSLADLRELAVPEDPSIAPDGSRVAYVLSTVDTEKDVNVRRLWCVDTDGGPPRRLTAGASDRSPRFSPDGRWIAFLRADGGAPQLWLLPVEGGEPEQVAELPLGAGVPVWSPDSAHIAFSAPVDSGLANNLGEPIGVVRGMHKLDGVGRLRGRQAQVFVLDIANRSVRQVTHGDHHTGTPAWSHDGARLAYPVAYAPHADTTGESWCCVLDIATGHAQRVGAEGGTVTSVTWHGSDVLLLSTPDTQVRNNRLVRVRPDGSAEDLTADLDRNLMPGGSGYPGGLPQVAADGETVLFCARDQGCTHLYALDDAGTRKLVDGNRVVSGLTVAAGASTAATVVSTVDSFGEVVLVDPSSGLLKALTAHTRETLGEVEPYVAEERRFAISDGVEVQGWLLRDPDAPTPAPLLVDVHGGPHNAWNGVRRSTQLYQQALVARGWAIALINPRGSDGYGEEFMRAAVGAWGLADERDFLEPVDALVAEGIADPRRLALCGYSYGGYMACWLPTRTGRFSAVVAGGVVSDLVSMAGTADVGAQFLPLEIGKSHWEDAELISGLSPMAHVGRVTSPTLVLHGEVDDRCPVGQAEQWFHAIRGQGVPTELVVYPGASHMFVVDGKPSHRADYDRRVVDWVVRHSRNGTSATASLNAAHWQRRLDVLAAELGVVGASLGIRHGDETVEAAYGVLNQRTGVSVTPDAVFQIGSISKVYTATALLRLVDEGKLDLDAPVLDVLPELELSDLETTKRLTTWHLLNHTSGIDGDYFLDTGRGDDCLERYVAALADLPANHPLGATFSYCNTGYSLAGLIIERIAGKTWDAAMRELVFEPLELTGTMTLPEEALCHPAAMGHVELGGGQVRPAARWHLPRSVGPAGSIVATARDVLAFALSHVDGGVLSAESARSMRALQAELPGRHPSAESWGLGWFRTRWDGHAVVGHDGATVGQFAFLRMLPDAGLAVTLLTNGGSARELQERLFREIVAEVAGLDMPAPFAPPDAPVAAELDRHVGLYQREGHRFEVIATGSGLRIHITTTLGVAEAADEEQQHDLVPVGENVFAMREAAGRSWSPVTFYQLADGTPYLSMSGRAARKVE